MTDNKKIHISLPSVGNEEWEALREPLTSGWITQGPKVAAFEKAFASKHQVSHAIATTSCTTALHIALSACGIGPGDEVIVPAFTWISTANAVEFTGARPVFCDVDRATFNIDALMAEKLITAKTRAVIPVHLFGLCADMKGITEIFKPRGIRVIEDAACASGAAYDNQAAGSLGDIGCFSFHPRKIITTGEGGMCTTSNKELADQMIRLRNHGASMSEEERHNGPRPYLLPEFNILGFNYRMTDLQGAVGLVQLSKLETFVNERRDRAEWYRKELEDIPWIQTPVAPDGFSHSYQAFVCYINEKIAPHPRNELMEKLHARGIATRPGTHAVHMLNYYAQKYSLNEDDFPAARDCDKFAMAIPLHNKMTDEDYEQVVHALKDIS